MIERIIGASARNLMLAVERAFDVDFAASQISSLQNVGELAALIQSKLA